MFTVTQALEKALLQHFMRQKLEIAYAINKPFPFFEGLRDNSFITERLYEESMEACRNLVPVSRVVYHVLTKLEKTFDVSLLFTLFSQTNLREYPNLMTVFISFRHVGATYGECRRTTPFQLEAPSNPAGGGPFQTLLPLPPPQPSPTNLHSHVPRVRDPRASSQQNEETLDKLDKLPSPSNPAVPLPRLIQEGKSTRVTSDNLTSKANEEEDTGETSSCPTGTVHVPSSDQQTAQRKDEEDSRKMSHGPSSPVPATHNNLTIITAGHEDSREMPGSPPGTVQVTRDGSPEPNNQEATPEAPRTTPNKKGKRKRNIWSTPKKKRQKKKCPPGTALSEHGTQEKLQVVDKRTQQKDDSTWDLKVVTSAQKARTACAAQMSRSEEKKRKRYSRSGSKRNHSQWLSRGAASPEHGTQEKIQVVGQRTQRKDNSASGMKVVTRSQKAKTKCMQMSTSDEKSEDDTVDFLSPTLPVTCGQAKGILYKEKMKPGSSEKCIQNEAGAWVTPKEFLIEGKRAKSKDWKKSVCCRGKTLIYLQKKGLLSSPSRKKLKRKAKSRCVPAALSGALLQTSCV